MVGLELVLDSPIFFNEEINIPKRLKTGTLKIKFSIPVFFYFYA